MKNNFSSLSDTELVSRIGAFCSVALENPTDYGLNGTEVEALSDANTLLNTNIDNYLAANGAKLAATSAKDSSREDVLTQMSSILKRVYGDPTVTDQDLNKASLAPRPSGPTYTTPNVPTNVNAKVVGPNRIEVKWNKANNIGGTLYSIEVQHGQGAWTLLDTITSTRFFYTVSEAGQPISFRVVAKRGNRTSQPSAITSLWSEEEENTLQIAA
ncbi:MAG: fibronectin type III domain-containing protein [Chthonomonas sp.]|nr:fibronectin type III domain-containing protein [Chthonomonas sp.]